MGIRDHSERGSDAWAAGLSGRLRPMLERLERRLLLGAGLESPQELDEPSTLASADLYDAGDEFSWFDPDKVQAGEA